jgi:hypothetical protein
MAKLYFYYAAMNAGKSTNLLQADFNYRERAAWPRCCGPPRSMTVPGLTGMRLPVASGSMPMPIVSGPKPICGRKFSPNRGRAGLRAGR